MTTGCAPTGGANTGDYVDARHSSDPKKKRPLGRFVMKQVAGYGGMCRQSSTLKADERSAGRVDRDFDGGCGCRPNRPPRARECLELTAASGTRAHLMRTASQPKKGHEQQQRPTVHRAPEHGRKRPQG